MDNIHNAGYISIYIHWPFCLKKCPYCDFNSYVVKAIDYPLWKKAYFLSIEKQQPFLQGKKIKSIFFGGGTPSLMPPELVHDLILYFKKHNNGGISEITLESNPSTFEIGRFKDFKDAGITRISTGIQSFNEGNLQFLGRNHNAKEAIHALEQSNMIFERASFDLIMGLPNQSLQAWQQELQQGIQLFKEHISIYQLTIEQGTPFFKRNITEAPEDIIESMYMWNMEELYKHNIEQYEISNFSLPSKESIHNLNYWKGGEYIGIGPDAHGRVILDNLWFATKEYKNPQVWLAKHMEQGSVLEVCDSLLVEERLHETTMTSLRLKGIIDSNIINQLDSTRVAMAVQQGLLVSDIQGIQVSQKGRLCLDYLIRLLLI